MAHPLHPAVVHFPIACWTISTFGDIASVWLGRSAWEFSGILLALGIATGIAAMITGMLDFGKIAHSEEMGATADAHMQLVLTAWILYALSLLLRCTELELQAPGIAEISLSGVGWLVLLAAGWQGGKLVYVHGAGVSRSED